MYARRIHRDLYPAKQQGNRDVLHYQCLATSQQCCDRADCYCYSRLNQLLFNGQNNVTDVEVGQTRLVRDVLISISVGEHCSFF